MRIPPAGKGHGIRPAVSTRPDAPAPPSPPLGSDHVELSALSLVAAGLGPERLQEIQATVQSGKYSVSPSEVSRQIVDFYLIPVD